MIPHAYDAEVLIAYALQGEQIRHISEVPRGLACNCRCAECHEALVARKGPERADHFSHTRPTDCHGGVETLLHRLAKELLAELRVIAVPEYRLALSELVGLSAYKYNEVVCPARQVEVSRVQIEYHFEDVVPDLILSTGDDRIVVEIAVTHRVDSIKLARLNKLGIPALEVRLIASDATLSRTDLANKLANDVDSKVWLFHPGEREHRLKFRALLDAANKQLNDRLRERRNFQWKSAQSSRRFTKEGNQSPSSSAGFIAWNNFAERFYRKHGRYPNLDETLAFQRRLSD